MSTEQFVFVAVLRLLHYLPMLIVGITGLWFALSRRRQHVHAYTWATWGFALLTAYAVTDLIVELSVAVSVSRSGALALESNIEPLTKLMNIWSVATYPLLIGGIVVVARAVFLGRPKSSSSVVAGAA